MSVNSKVKLEDGSALLIEGKPSLLDHLAICEQGVWDKGGEPAGITINDSHGETKVTEEEMKADAARKDAEEKERADKARADAEAGEKLDKVLKCVDSIMGRMDAMEERQAKADAAVDVNEKERADKARKDAEGEGDQPGPNGEPERVAADRARKDAEEKEEAERADKARKDEQAEEARERADSELSRRIADVEKALPKHLSDADYSALADAQARADGVFQAFGDSAPRPLQGEDLPAYRRRLAGKAKVHSPQWRDVNLHAILDDTAFTAIENGIYADAAAAARSPIDVPAGQLREIKSRDTTGRQISSFAGQPRDWMSGFSGRRRRLSGIQRG